MKMLLKFLTLLICFELVVAPLADGLGMTFQNARAEGCPAGQSFNSELNRCLTTDQTAQVMYATQECNGDKECYMRNATTALDKKIADGSASSYKGLNRTASGLVTTVTTAVPIAMAFSLAKSTGTCSGVSFWLFVGAGAAMFFGDMFINMAHYKRLKKIKSEWGKIVNPTDAGGDIDKERELTSNAQAEAFGKLADAEKSLATAASSKATLYWIATAAYAAAGITAGLEQFEIIGNAPCTWVAPPPTPVGDSAPNYKKFEHYASTPKKRIIKSQSLFDYYSSGGESLNLPSSQHYNNLLASENFTSLIMNQKAFEQKNSSPTIDEYEVVSQSLKEVKNLSKDAPEAFNTFKQIMAKVGHELNPLPSANAEAEKSNAAVAFEEDGKAFDAWTWISLLGGAALGATILLASNKIKALMVQPTGRMVLGGVLALMTGLLASHASSVSQNATERAEVLNKMKAEFQGSSNAIYSCKSEDREDPGKPNCYCYTPQNQKNPSRGNSQVCQRLWAGPNVKFKNTFATADTGKTCVNDKRSADPSCACRKTGTCLKVGVGNLSGISMGTLKMLNSSLSPMNNMTNGNASMADLQGGNPQAAAMRMIEAKKELLNSPQFAKYKDTVKKAEAQLETQLANMAAKSPQSDLLGGGSSMPKNPLEAARILEKELKQNGPEAVAGNQEVIAAPSNKPEEKMPEFGLSGSQLEDQKSKVAEVMKDDFDYGGNEINDSSKSNIFELLSKRYQQSGMKRLFDEGEKK